jgi:hypothetical protein
VSESRRSVFERAIEVTAGVSDDDPATIFTDDVQGWSPNFRVSSLAELAETIADRADTLSNLVLVINGITVVGHKASAEWRLDADNTGPLYNGDEVLIEATGHHVHLAGAIFADFRDDRIKSFRMYFDDLALVEQLVGR